jgi:capsular exopolysaccharide synthesis family protein
MKVEFRDKKEYEVDLKKIVTVFYRFRYMIILFALFGAVSAAIYGYFKPNIYQATTTVEVQVRSWFSIGDKDPRANALTGEMVSNINTEMEIIKSRFVSEKALRRVDFSHRYFVEKGLLEKELYKKSPFQVDLSLGYGRSFYLFPIDEKSFRLETELVVEGKKKKFSQIYSYGERISNLFFDMKIDRRPEYNMDAKKYRFVILDPRTLAPSVASGVSVYPVSRKSTVLGVSYTGTVPQRVQEFSVALAEVYLEQSVERRTWEASKTIVLIDKQIENIKKKIENITKKIEDFRKETHTVNVDKRVERLSDKLAELESQMITLQLQDELLKSFYDKIRSGKSLETLTLAGIGLEDQALFELLKELRELIMKKRELLRDYTSAHPLVKKNKARIKLLSKIIAEAVGNIYKGLQEKEKFLQRQIEKMENELAMLPESQRKYLTLKRSLQANESFYAFLLEKRTEAEIRKTSNMNLNRILDKALVPDGPIAPKRKIYIAIGTILGLFLGILFAFIRDIMDDRVKTEDELKTLTEVPMLGTIPHFQRGTEKNDLVVMDDPKSLAAEAFRNIRTNLQFMSMRESGIVMAVTSTIQGEGKTLISVNLASIISMTGKKVLLMSMDMRRPALHRLFGISSDKGMSNILSNHSTLEEVIQHEVFENLDIIPSGPVPPNPSELIGSEMMSQILEELKSRYDIIVIDTPPVGPVTDSKLLIPYCDIVAYILRAGYSRKNFVDAMEEIYAEKDKHGVGFVLNDFDVNKHGYGYSYGYGYGYAAKYGYYYGNHEEKGWFERLFSKKRKHKTHRRK